MPNPIEAPLFISYYLDLSPVSNEYAESCEHMKTYYLKLINKLIHIEDYVADTALSFGQVKFYKDNSYFNLPSKQPNSCVKFYYSSINKYLINVDFYYKDTSHLDKDFICAHQEHFTNIIDLMNDGIQVKLRHIKAYSNSDVFENLYIESLNEHAMSIINAKQKYFYNQYLSLFSKYDEEVNQANAIKLFNIHRRRIKYKVSISLNESIGLNLDNYLNKLDKYHKGDTIIYHDFQRFGMHVAISNISQVSKELVIGVSYKQIHNEHPLDLSLRLINFLAKIAFSDSMIKNIDKIIFIDPIGYLLDVEKENLLTIALQTFKQATSLHQPHHKFIVTNPLIAKYLNLSKPLFCIYQDYFIAPCIDMGYQRNLVEKGVCMGLSLVNTTTSIFNERLHQRFNATLNIISLVKSGNFDDNITFIQRAYSIATSHLNKIVTECRKEYFEEMVSGHENNGDASQYMKISELYQSQKFVKRVNDKISSQYEKSLELLRKIIVKEIIRHRHSSNDNENIDFFLFLGIKNIQGAIINKSTILKSFNKYSKFRKCTAFLQDKVTTLLCSGEHPELSFLLHDVKEFMDSIVYSQNSFFDSDFNERIIDMEYFSPKHFESAFNFIKPVSFNDKSISSTVIPTVIFNNPDDINVLFNLIRKACKYYSKQHTLKMVLVFKEDNLEGAHCLSIEYNAQNDYWQLFDANCPLLNRVELEDISTYLSINYQYFSACKSEEHLFFLCKIVLVDKQDNHYLIQNIRNYVVNCDDFIRITALKDTNQFDNLQQYLYSLQISCQTMLCQNETFALKLASKNYFDLISQKKFDLDLGIIITSLNGLYNHFLDANEIRLIFHFADAAGFKYGSLFNDIEKLIQVSEEQYVQIPFIHSKEFAKVLVECNQFNSVDIDEILINKIPSFIKSLNNRHLPIQEKLKKQYTQAANEISIFLNHCKDCITQQPKKSPSSKL